MSEKNELLYTPFKALALQLLPQLHPGRHILLIPNLPRQIGELEVELLPFVHPDQRHPRQVGVQRVGDAARKAVRGRSPEEVPDVRTGRYLNPTAALPHAEGHLEIFAAPYAHAFVVGADLIEVAPVDGEEAAGHCGSTKWQSCILENK